MAEVPKIGLFCDVVNFFAFPCQVDKQVPSFFICTLGSKEYLFTSVYFNLLPQNETGGYKTAAFLQQNKFCPFVNVKGTSV